MTVTVIIMVMVVVIVMQVMSIMNEWITVLHGKEMTDNGNNGSSNSSNLREGVGITISISTGTTAIEGRAVGSVLMPLPPMMPTLSASSNGTDGDED